MIKQFKGYIKYTNEQYENIWKHAIVVVDTNILLYFYKYSTKETAEKLLQILHEFSEKERLFIPHQVALEYFFNYENNMFNQKDGYKNLKIKLDRIIGEFNEKTNEEIKDAKDKNPFIKPDEFSFIFEYLELSKNELEKKVKEEINNIPNSDEIHKSILKILDNNIGHPFNQDEIDIIQKEGKERYELKVPPGFEDKSDKNEQRFYGGIKYQLQYGDLILWKQIIERIKSLEHARPVLFITEDNKEDWWHIKKGQTKGPHPNLVQEFFDETGQNFHMYSTSRFIEYASKHLSIELDDSQLSMVSDELKSIRTAEEKRASEFKKYFEESNYKTLIDKSNVSIKEILNYLPTPEKDQGYTLIKNALHNRKDLAAFNEAVFLIIDKAMPYLEETAKDLHTNITIDGHGYEANNYLNQLNSLPDDTVERGIKLLGLIKDMDFFYNDPLPF